MLIAAVLSFAGSSLTEEALSWLGVDVDSVLGIIASRAVTLFIAVIVYERLGLRLLRRAWFNIDRVWAGVLIATASLTPFIA